MATPNRIKPENERKRIDQEGGLSINIPPDTARHLAQVARFHGRPEDPAAEAQWVIEEHVLPAILMERLGKTLEDVPGLLSTPEAIERFLEAGGDAVRPLEEVREDLRRRDSASFLVSHSDT